MVSDDTYRLTINHADSGLKFPTCKSGNLIPRQPIRLQYQHSGFRANESDWLMGNNIANPTRPHSTLRFT